jgi:uncharacterized glyoxalase superfamily protein PhnB
MTTIDKLMMLSMAVSDVDKAREFYAERLGFKVTSDSKDFRPGKDRWVTILPPGGGAPIVLTNVAENMKPGTLKLYLSTADIEAAYKELMANGVKPKHEVTKADWGTFFDFNDPDGNQWIVEETKY